MNYTQPEIVLCTSALASIQGQGKYGMEQELDNPNRQVTVPAYEADE